MKKTLFISTIALVSGLWACVKEDDGTPDARNLPTITMGDLTLEEGDANDTIYLEVNLVGENKANAVVRFAGVAGTATANDDYELLNSGQLIFAPGETQKTLAIKIVGDELRETKETFEVKLYNPINLALTKDVSVITINDDDNNTAGLTIPTGGYITPVSYPGYNLTWSDEFDGAALNTTDWNYEIGDGCPGNCGWGNNELEYYREDNTSIVDGNLVITAKKQQFGGRNYTSSRLTTKGKQQFKFGRIDIRAALPEGKGLWPALWMLGSNIDAVSWPACGEIDIMELTGDLPTRVLGTVHFGANFNSRQYITQSKYLSGNANFQDEFHVFSLVWVADKIEFLVDDEVYHTITPADMNGAAYPFNKPFFFIFNVAVGGNLPGNPDNSTPFPQHMIVDYVRVFQ